MRKTVMLIAAATALIISSLAQNQPSQDAGRRVSKDALIAQNPVAPPNPATQQNPATTPNPATNENPAADTPSERNLPDSVDIVGVPKATPNKNSATITWDTNKEAATDVWLEGGDITGHRTGYQKGAAKNHSVTFSNLKPNTTYNYKIRTRKGEVRYEGTFTTKG
jgi:hypothetical protein